MALFMYFNLNMLNKRQERLENEDLQLTTKELQRLQTTADVEGIDLAAVRRLQKGFRYVLQCVVLERYNSNSVMSLVLIPELDVLWGSSYCSLSVGCKLCVVAHG
jgi:hypothetical protein